jgi:hypothetical protein
VRRRRQDLEHPRPRPVFHRRRDVDHRRPRRRSARDHRLHFRGDDLIAELEAIDRLRLRPQLRDLVERPEEERLARADRRAHRPLADARPVVAHVALHHDFPVLVELGDAERTGDDAVAAGDAPRPARRLDDAVAGALDGVGRADLGAGRLLAVHADDRDGLDALGAADELEVDHRLAAMRVALRAGVEAGLAADAAAGIDEEMERVRLHCWASSDDA